MNLINGAISPVHFSLVIIIWTSLDLILGTLQRPISESAVKHSERKLAAKYQRRARDCARLLVHPVYTRNVECQQGERGWSHEIPPSG